ncbi:MAG: NrfD/PsrC family molybdoenzyme membrane anchor subunit [Tepidisphaeraceae bacterium]
MAPEAAYTQPAASPDPRALLKTLGPMGAGGRCAVAALAAVLAWGGVAYVHQLRYGLAVTAMNDYFSWGVYIINFVFFIGISMAGTLISAGLRLMGASWRHPITRLAEAITLFALLVAGPLVIIDMGRPDRFFHVLVYGRLQSPILWDVFSLTTYMAGSVLYLYLPLIPDLALLRDTQEPMAPWRHRAYAILAVGWRGTPSQYAALHRAITVMAIAIMPVAISIHTVTSWIFGMTLRPGWHSTIIGPDFVIGALYSGVAAVITAIALFRRCLHLGQFITTDHIRKLGILLLVMGLAYVYFVVNEYLGAGYTNQGLERQWLHGVFAGQFSIQFWTMILTGLIIPILLLALPGRHVMGRIVVASVLVNVGMWLKRYIIIVPTLGSPYMPLPPGAGRLLMYVPTWVEWSITAGAFAAFCLMYILFAKFVPIVSMWELAEAAHPQALADSPDSRGDRPSHPSPTQLSTPSVMTLLLIAAFAWLALDWPRSTRGEAPSPTPATQPSRQISVDLTTTHEEGKLVLQAAVRVDGKPATGAEVEFFARRTFGDLPLGTDTTLDDGTCQVPFPTDLPGNAAGELDCWARVKSPANLAGATAAAHLSGARAFVPRPNPFPRALWAPRAPVGLLVTIGGLLAAAWGSYGYALIQIVRIRKAAA